MNNDNTTQHNEGLDAYSKRGSNAANPYPWTNETWWMNQQWQEGYEAAKQAYEDDD